MNLRYALLPLLLILPLLSVGCGTDDSASASAPRVDSTDTRSHTLGHLIENNRDLYLLYQALEATDFDLELREVGPFTVFAPTNRAMEQGIPDLDSLIQEGADTLRIILEQHVVRGTIQARQPGDNLDMSNLKGSQLTLTQMPNEEIRVNNQQVASHQRGKNGMLYLIDTVLRPGPRVESATEEVREDAEMPDPEQEEVQLDTPTDTPAPDEPLPNLPPDN